MPHLLIVEDEKSTSWALAEGLSDDGYTIDTFRTAEEAQRWLRRGTSDLVITDLRLPGLTGIEFAHKLTRSRHAQPVILVSAYSLDGMAEELASAGIVDVFAKPFQMEALRRSVRRALLTVTPRRAPARRAA